MSSSLCMVFHTYWRKIHPLMMVLESYVHVTLCKGTAFIDASCYIIKCYWSTLYLYNVLVFVYCRLYFAWPWIVVSVVLSEDVCLLWFETVAFYIVYLKVQMPLNLGLSKKCVRRDASWNLSEDFICKLVFFISSVI